MISQIATISSLVIGALMASSAIAAPVNLVSNPGFEDGFLGWTLDFQPNSEGWELGAGRTGAGAGVTDKSQAFLFHDLPDTATSMIREFSFYINQTLGHGANTTFFAFQIFYASGLRDQLLPEVPTGVWSRVDLTAALVSGGVLTGFGVFGTDPATNRVDDFTVALVPLPASGLLLVSWAVPFVILARTRYSNPPDRGAASPS